MELSIRLLFFCQPLLSRSVAAGEVTGLEIKTKYGVVRGNINSEGSRQFVSVPFAAPPVGNLRFRPPQEPTSWEGERDCSCTLCLSLPKCLQTSPLTASKPLLLPPMGPGQEDCLYLHIFTPNPLPTKLAPVAIWLFGGGYQTGDAYFTGMYSGARLAQKHGIVVVAPNYRLGALGFLAHRELAAEAGANGTGNYAMLDQQFAMRWVQENIAAFGGDPLNVGIFGQSAGAFSIAAHMASPSSAGLFHRAIFQSSSFEGDYFFQPLQRAQEFGASWAKHIGCDADKLGKDQFLKCLRDVRAETLVEGTMYPTYPSVRPMLFPVMPWGPVIDGVFLSDYPRNRVSQGMFNRVPVIIGTVHDEGTLFESAMALVSPGAAHIYPPNRKEDVEHLLQTFFDKATIDKALSLYPVGDYSSNCTGYWMKSHQEQCILKWQANAILRDYFFKCASKAMARTFSKQGVPVWLYQFNYDFEGQGMYHSGAKLEMARFALGVNPGQGGLGVFHMAEIPFIFGSEHAITTKLFVGDFMSSSWSSRHQQMSNIMQGYWSSMFKMGNPNTAGLAEWPTYSTDSESYMQLDVPSVAVKPNLSHCDFWDTVGYSSPTERDLYSKQVLEQLVV